MLIHILNGLLVICWIALAVAITGAVIAFTKPRR
jgi:hypothetical protein